MSLAVLGENISEIEVTNISNHGIWLYSKDREFFLSYRDFPWFKDKKVDEILDVVMLSDNHFYWEKLDIDLSVEMIENPERFPLIVKENEN